MKLAFRYSISNSSPTLLEAASALLQKINPFDEMFRIERTTRTAHYNPVLKAINSITGSLPGQFLAATQAFSLLMLRSKTDEKDNLFMFVLYNRSSLRRKSRVDKPWGKKSRAKGIFCKRRAKSEELNEYRLQVRLDKSRKMARSSRGKHRKYQEIQ